ncbi:hypothetical protein Q1695_005397 [Nippostrongylus brasiliensis]|nr:hypothetical protein Q1695_005397 [Nippostrongylus brasiliensis]
MPSSKATSWPLSPIDEHFWINQQYQNSPSTYESDDEFYSEFGFSDIGHDAFQSPEYEPRRRIIQETVDENSELVVRPEENCDTPEESQNGDKSVLNCGPSDKRTYSVAEYNEMLVQIMDSLFEEILTDNGKMILMHKLPSSSTFQNYLSHANNLPNIQLKTASPDERLALFLNIYNMMTIHITCINGRPRNMWDRRKMMYCSYYQIEDHRYALHSILDGILRSNRRGLEMLWKPFGKNDGRLPLILPKFEPFVHFGLNSCTKSTSFIRPYTCKNVRQELRQNAWDALETDDFVKVDMKRNVVHLNKIFKWYAKDFGGTEAKVIDWILSTLSDSNSEKKTDLGRIHHLRLLEIEYIPYDWTFNGK